MAISDPHTHPIWATIMVCVGAIAVIIALVLGTTVGTPDTDQGAGHENSSERG